MVYQQLNQVQVRYRHKEKRTRGKDEYCRGRSEVVTPNLKVKRYPAVAKPYRTERSRPLWRGEVHSAAPTMNSCS